MSLGVRADEMFHLSADEIEAVRLSLRVAFWAMLWSMPFGLAAALVLARGRFWGKSLLDGAIHLPLVMPPVGTGYLLLLLFGHNGPLGRFFAAFGIVFAFRWTGAALAAAVTAFPLMVRAMRLSLEAIDRRLEEAAGTLGARGIFVFLLRLRCCLDSLPTRGQTVAANARAEKTHLCHHFRREEFENDK